MKPRCRFYSFPTHCRDLLSNARYKTYKTSPPTDILLSPKNPLPPKTFLGQPCIPHPPFSIFLNHLKNRPQNHFRSLPFHTCNISRSVHLTEYKDPQKALPMG